MSLILAFREAGVVRFGLPSIPRQTPGRWFYVYGMRWASMMWGLDIGLTFSTWITFGGLWSLVAAIIWQSDELDGALVLAAYWTGRALSTLLMPLIITSAAAVRLPIVMRSVAVERAVYRKMQAAGLFVATALGAWAAFIDF